MPTQSLGDGTPAGRHHITAEHWHKPDSAWKPPLAETGETAIVTADRRVLPKSPVRPRSGNMPVRCAAVFLLTTLYTAPALAADVETRVYNVQVDGKAAGEFRLTIRTADDGTETAIATAAVQVRSLLGGYRYSYTGTEVWKNGRLQRFESTSDDDGKKHTVAAEATTSAMRLTVDGVARTGHLDVWPTTYWRMPPSVKTGQAITLLDADTGEEQAAKIESIGRQQQLVAGKKFDCSRIAITAAAPATAYYDARGRMVGLTTTEDGHETILSLREIQR
jgi:Family of unknown function (DUF6134)